MLAGDVSKIDCVKESNVGSGVGQVLPTLRLFDVSTALVFQFSSPVNLQLLNTTMIYMTGFTAPKILFQIQGFGQKCGYGV